MPELPEVETVRIQLEDFLVGHTIENVEVKHQKIFEGNSKIIIGAKIKDVRRFAKVLCIDLSNKYSIVIHIKLTGQLIYRGKNLKKPPKLSKKISGGVPGPHTHIIFELDRDSTLFYNDIRRFGWIRVMKTSEVEKTGFVSKLGPEPMVTESAKKNPLTLSHFKEILGKTRRSIKVVIMDQAKISGVGNIYANDALWLSGIDPKRTANSLSSKEAKILYDAIETVLKMGLKNGGASELAFVTPDGSEGSYQKHFLIYGQGGRVCTKPACSKKGIKIAKISIGGRGTYLCKNCQK